MVNIKDTDFDEIFDHWRSKKRHGHHWEGDTGVRNFEDLTKDIGYDQGIDQFLADNPGAIETILEWIAEHAEKGGIEWKENLAKACDYDPAKLEEADEDMVMQEAEEDDPENRSPEQENYKDES